MSISRQSFVHSCFNQLVHSLLTRGAFTRGRDGGHEAGKIRTVEHVLNGKIMVPRARTFLYQCNVNFSLAFEKWTIIIACLSNGLRAREVNNDCLTRGLRLPSSLGRLIIPIRSRETNQQMFPRRRLFLFLELFALSSTGLLGYWPPHILENIPLQELPDFNSTNNKDQSIR